MNLRIASSIFIMAILYVGINYYLGYHIWLFIEILFPTIHTWIQVTFWIVLFFLGFSFFLSRVIKDYVPRGGFKFIHAVGAYWMGIFFYLFLFLILADILGIVLFTLTSLSRETIILTLGTFIFISLLFIILKGRYNALHTQVVHYDVSISKENKYSNHLKAILVSDLHLSTLVTNRRLEKLVKMINTLSPDIIFIAGDIIDEDITPFVEQQMTETLKKLNPKIGTFAVPGNHDYYGGHIQHLEAHLQEAGIHFLLDKTLLIKDSFYVIGRKDYASKDRTELEQLMQPLDTTKPLFLLDHQPLSLDIPTKLGIDLQVSGHTHRGQFMPNHYITKKIFEVDWGYLQKGLSHFIVSSGFGTWGPPIRNLNPSEIVTINITFKTTD